MKITVTAGHGGTDPGATFGSMTEAGLMSELRDKVAEILRAAGHEVATDGHGRENEPLAEALKRIAGSEIAIELHTNAAASPQATGVEAISLADKKAPAQRIARAIASALGLRLRGDGGWIDQAQSARGRLAYVSQGGIIVEVFFLSNAGDRSAYLVRRDEVAAAIAGALA